MIESKVVSNPQLAEYGKFVELISASLGLEPRKTDPKSAVLPLHHKANGAGYRI